MPQKVWEDPLLDASGAGKPGHDRQYRAGRIARMPIALEQKSRLTPLEMGAQFVRQRRQDRHVAISSTLGVDDVNLRWVAIQKKILDADVHELITLAPVWNSVLIISPYLLWLR